jgi:hypothetical protein
MPELEVKVTEYYSKRLSFQKLLTDRALIIDFPQIHRMVYFGK